MHDRVMGRTQICFIEAYTKSLKAALTFDPAKWFLFATYCLVMIITCVVFLFYVHSKQQRMRDLWLLSQTCHRLRYKAYYFKIPPCMIVIGQAQTDFLKPMHEVYVQTVTLTFGIVTCFFVQDTSSSHDDHLCKIIFKSHHA